MDPQVLETLWAFISNDPQAVLMLPLALLIGFVAKKSAVNDKYIPVITVILSTLLAWPIVGRDINSLVVGFIAGLLAVTGYTATKQIKDK